jgi:DNA invertase Pin-like site-specific DNA recombinase
MCALASDGPACRKCLSRNHEKEHENTESASNFALVSSDLSIIKFIDSGISEVKDFRPQLDRLMADAYRRRFDIVAVWKFDRFARSVSHLLRALETFRSLGIEFVSLSEQVDTSTPTGKMVFTVLGAVAELERSLTGERVRAGLRNARAKGKRLGRPPLKVLSAAELQQLRRERRRLRTSFKKLARKYGISVWSAFELCQGAKV